MSDALAVNQHHIRSLLELLVRLDDRRRLAKTQKSRDIRETNLGHSACLFHNVLGSPPSYHNGGKEPLAAEIIGDVGRGDGAHGGQCMRSVDLGRKDLLRIAGL
jgi:hypothetical protein